MAMMMMMMHDANPEDMVGKTMCAVRWCKEREGDLLYFESEDGAAWKLYHKEDCSENVYIEDICGDLEDLVGAPILQAEEVSSDYDGGVPAYVESYTWTFYKFATIKGSVTVR